MRPLLIGCAGLALIAASPAPSDPDPARLKANVETLVSFGTRHTLSSPTHPKRGIGAARRWAASEFARLGKACGGCLTVELPSKRFDGPRAPNGVEVVDVLGIQPGTDGSKDVVIVAGHIDSRVTDPMDAASDAPGANDDGSGTALVLEAARLLSTSKHRATIVYAILSGEEQGLWGGRLLAETAKAKGWAVLAMLNNDIVGNSVGTNGRVVADRVRVFSEGIRFSEDEAMQRARRGDGGEDDGPSRALAKAVARLSKSRADPSCGGLIVLVEEEIICRCSKRDFLRFASLWAWRIMMRSTRMCGVRLRGSSATPWTG
jgi:Zn-dependent M28 family amino/carboxypeptidase